MATPEHGYGSLHAAWQYSYSNYGHEEDAYDAQESSTDISESIAESSPPSSPSSSPTSHSVEIRRPRVFRQPVTRQKFEVPCNDGKRPAPCPRFGHTAVVHNDDMVVFGGRHSICLGDVWSFNFKTRCWKALCETNFVRPSPRAGHTAVVYGGKMFVFGGVGDRTADNWLNDMWMLDLETFQWECVSNGTGAVPAGRKGHTAVVCKGSMFIFGGGQDDATLHNDIWEFRFETLTWKQRTITGLSPTARMYHVAVLVPGDRMVVFGGRAQTKSGFLNDLLEVRLNPGDTVCEVIKHCPTGRAPTHRMCSTAIYHDNTIAIFTGGSVSYLDDSHQLDLHNMRWSKIEDVTFGGRTRPTTVMWGNTILTFGGCVHSNGYVNDFVEVELEPMSLLQMGRLFLLENGISQREGFPASLVKYIDG
eukprot:TRINITY_DN7018_c0_g1_i2.p1 TRINITY_DN7018_c0_g1~~TRINITY_DN7018_c0_g1_i2.p1  ORF type:complete len:438 (+),score=115.69 TRINITY_DN7018_c0_g1_i2:60-1316(+)